MLVPCLPPARSAGSRNLGLPLPASLPGLAAGSGKPLPEAAKTGGQNSSPRSVARHPSSSASPSTPSASVACRALARRRRIMAAPRAIIPMNGCESSRPSVVVVEGGLCREWGGTWASQQGAGSEHASRWMVDAFVQSSGASQPSPPSRCLSVEMRRRCSSKSRALGTTAMPTLPKVRGFTASESALRRP